MSGLFNSLFNAARGGNVNQGGAGPDDVESSSDGSQNPESPGLWQGDPTGTENVFGSPTAVEEQWAGLGTGNVNTRRPTYGRTPTQQAPQHPPHAQPFTTRSTSQASPQVLYPTSSFGQAGSMMGGAKQGVQAPLPSFPQAPPQHPQQQSVPPSTWVQPQNVPLPLSPNALQLSMEGGHQSTPKRKTRPLPRNPDGQNTPMLSPVGRTEHLSSLPLPTSHAAPQSAVPPPPPQQAAPPSRQQSRLGTAYDNTQFGGTYPRQSARASEEHNGGDGQGPDGIWVGGRYYRVYPQTAGADGGADGMWLNGTFYGLQPTQETTPHQPEAPRVQTQPAQAPPPQPRMQPQQPQAPMFPPQQPPRPFFPQQQQTQFFPQQQQSQFFPQQQLFPQPFPQFAPQPQYIQVPARRERQLPPTDKYEALKGNTNFPTWSHWVRNLLAASGLLSHISRPGEPGLRQSQRPTYPPTEDSPGFEDWWVDDDAARHVVTSRVDPAILRSLPTVSPIDGGAVTARELWELLGKQYGAGMISTTLQKWNSIVGRRITAGQAKDLVQYATDFREAYNAMVVSGQPLSNATIFITIANALPEVGGLAGFARELRNTADSYNVNSVHPTQIFEQLDREIKNYLDKHPSASSSSSSRRSANSSRTGSKLICENCKKEGHDKAKCWASGGGAEGRRDEMVAAMRDRRGLSSTSRTAGVAAVASVPLQAPSTPAPPTPSIVANGGATDGGGGGVEVRVPHVASVVTSIPQFQPLSLYDVALVANARIFPEGYDHLLDSGCTLHLFNSRDVFWDFDSGSTQSMTTANCGDLETSGRGVVKLRLTKEDGSGFDLSLSDCRYAPSAPSNLLSVGALQDKGVGINYASDGETYIDLCGHYTFRALRLGNLSFLKAEILYPPGVDVAAVSFRPRAMDPETWHRRFGHLGMADTRRMLLGSYATGIKYSGEMRDELCPPCVVAKGSRQPVGPLGKRADRALEVVHIDVSGPYSTLTRTGAYPGKFAYYIIFLDDWSNYGHTVLLKDRSSAAIRDAFIEWRGWMEKKTGCVVEGVKMDGAKELTKGAFGDYLKAEKIFVDNIIPYHHWQNGKAERYIQTIDNTSRSMLAGSLLPPSYWGDAVLAAQYLRNRLPTSTLPRDVTPFERVFNEKPDLSHLRVFGCLGHAWIPTEKRRKGDHRRTPVILVGYDAVHKAYWVVTHSGSYMKVSDVFFFEDTQGRLQKIPTPTGEPPRTAKSAPVAVEEEHEPTMADIRAERLASLRSATRQNDLPPPVSMFLVLPDGVSAMVSYEVACSLVGNPTPDGDPDPRGTFDDESVAFEYVFIATRDDPSVFNRVRTPREDLSRPPRTMKEAMARKDWPFWLAAMKTEVKGLFEMGTFIRVDVLPRDRRAIPLLWVYAFKYDELGNVIAYKARLVVQGCRQRPEDYGTTSSPVARMSCIKSLLAWACKMNWSIFSFDIKTAFLHAKLRETVFVGQIPGFPEAQGAVYQLLRALYGLKQSAYEFYLFLKDSLGKIGMFHCDVDRAVFVGIWTSSPDSSIPMPANGDPLVLMIPVHVDDGLATTNCDPLYAWFIRRLSELMQVKDLGPATLYLGIRIVRDRENRRLWLSQRSYIEDLLSEWKLSACTGHRIPLPRSPDDPVNMSDNAFKNYTDEQVRAEYLRLVGSILYLAICTRPDLSYTAMALAQHNASPTRGHLAAAKGVLRYLATTVDLALQYPAPCVPNPDRSSILASEEIRVETCGFSDADWASDTKDRRSVTGHAVYFMGSLVSWSANKQRVVALSSNEAELYALSHLAREILWFRMFLQSVRLPCPRPFPLFSDNQSTVAMVHAENINGRSKHIDVRHHFIRDHIKSGDMSTKWLSTKDNVADIFTKSLPKDLFYLHRTNLGLVPLPVTETAPCGS